MKKKQFFKNESNRLGEINVARRGESHVYDVVDDKGGIGAVIFPPEKTMPEHEAIEQLMRFGRVKSLSGRGAVALAGMSDLHPNHPIPVGAVLATPMDMVVPSAIGNDINCGMRMVRYDFPCDVESSVMERARVNLRSALVDARRDAPLQGRHFKMLFDEGVDGLLKSDFPSEGLWKRFDKNDLKLAAWVSPSLPHLDGRSERMPESLMQDRLIRDPGLGTLGSGNHFFEMQWLDERLDKKACYAAGIGKSAKSIYALIHTGSRDVGQWVGSIHSKWARDAWLAAKSSAPEGIYTLEGLEARKYLQAQWAAARYAWFNRSVLQEMARQAFEDALNLSVHASVISDCSHNIAMIENGRVIHRKGACRACQGDLALIPGSMGDYSFVAMGAGHGESMDSCSHGAGRAKSRGAAVASGSSKLPMSVETPNGRRLIEEAPWNYMDVEAGVQAQFNAGLIHGVARMKPWVTFKS